MKDVINGLKYGISYFSFLPLKAPYFEANKEFYKGVVFSLPFVGFLLSIITIGLFLILPFPPLYKAILCSVLYLFLYGFIHLEAVADTIDGYFASLSNKDVHSIMKEPHIGSLGAIGTFCFVLLKVLAISFLLYFEHYILIVIALILSRSSLLFALDLEYHENSSFINSLKSSFQTPVFIKILFLPLNILTKFILNQLKKHLGFLNGDTLGFTIELQEILLLNLGILLCNC